MINSFNLKLKDKKQIHKPLYKTEKFKAKIIVADLLKLMMFLMKTLYVNEFFLIAHLTGGIKAVALSKDQVINV